MKLIEKNQFPIYLINTKQNQNILKDKLVLIKETIKEGKPTYTTILHENDMIVTRNKNKDNVFTDNLFIEAVNKLKGMIDLWFWRASSTKDIKNITEFGIRFDYKHIITTSVEVNIIKKGGDDFFKMIFYHLFIPKFLEVIIPFDVEILTRNIIRYCINLALLYELPQDAFFKEYL